MATEENKLTNYQPIIGDEADIKKVAKKCSRRKLQG